MEDKKKKKELNIVLEESDYPLFDEVDKIFNNIKAQFQEVTFENTFILTDAQEDKMFNFLSNPSFDSDMKENLKNLNAIQGKINTALIAENKVSVEVSNRLRHNLKKVLSFKDKIQDFQATKTRLASIKKEDKTTERSLILNESAKNASDINETKKERTQASKRPEPTYIDNIGDKEKTHIHFHEYDYEKNQKTRVSITEVFKNIEEMIEKMSEFSNSFKNDLSDDSYMAWNKGDMKGRIIYQNNSLIDDRTWARNIINDLKSARKLNDLDKDLKTRVEKLLDVIDLEMENLKDMGKELDNNLAQKGDKYNQIIRDDIEKEISNLYINKVTDGATSNKESNDLSVMYEKFVIISKKIERLEDGNEIKKEYTEKLKELSDSIKDRLAKENKDKKQNGEESAENTSGVKIKNFLELSEDEKKKLAASPSATAKLFDAVTTGEIKTANGTRKLTDREKSHLNEILEDVYNYRLESQGLVNIEVEEKNGFKSVTVKGKNKDPLKCLETLKMKGSMKARVLSNGKNSQPEEEIGMEL